MSGTRRPVRRTASGGRRSAIKYRRGGRYPMATEKLLLLGVGWTICVRWTSSIVHLNTLSADLSMEGLFLSMDGFLGWMGLKVWLQATYWLFVQRPMGMV